jgi:hypothetical protein
MAEIIKGLRLLYCLVKTCTIALDDSASPATIKSLNITGIPNFNQTVNATWSTSNFTFTTTVDSSAFHAALASVTAANEHVNALSTTSIPLSTTVILASSSTIEIFSTAVPKDLESYVVDIHPTSTGSATATSGDHRSFSGMTPTNTTNGELAAAHISSSVTPNPPSSILDHSMMRNHSEPIETYSTTTTTYLEPTGYRLLATRIPSGHLVSANISPGMTFSPSISVPDPSTTRSFSELTNIHPETNLHTSNVQLASQNGSSGMLHDTSVSSQGPETAALYSKPADNTSNSQLSAATGNYSSTTKLDPSFSAQDYVTKGVHTVPTINVPNGQSAPAFSNLSRITRPNTSIFHQDNLTAVSYLKISSHSPIIYSATASNVSGTARLRSPLVALNHSTRVPFIHPMSNSSNTHLATANYSSGTPRHGSLFVEILKSVDRNGGTVKDASENHPSNTQSSIGGWTPNSNASQIVGQPLNFINLTDASMAIASFTRQVCKVMAASNSSVPCNTSDPAFTLENLRNVTALFSYSNYFDELNDLEKFPDEPEIVDVEYFEMTLENIKRSQAFEWYNCWTVRMQGTPEWAQHGEWALFYREFFGESNFHCDQGYATCTIPPPKISEIQAMFPENRPLGRRVLFIAHTYNFMHGITTAVDVCFPPSPDPFLPANPLSLESLHTSQISLGNHWTGPHQDLHPSD